MIAALWIAWPPLAAAAEPDLARLDELRSAVAEAVALQRAEAEGHLTRPYADGLRDDLARDLRELASDPQTGPQARAALTALYGRDTRALIALRDRLVALEKALGRAA